MKLKYIYNSIALLLVSFGMYAQINIPSATAVTENFNTIGATTTATLPTGIRVNATANYSTGTSATTLAYGTTGTGVVTGTSSGGTINWANGVTASSTDRALGFLTAGAFSSPRSILIEIKNTSSSAITALSISFDYEKYRSGSRAFDWTFFHGATATLVNTAAAAGNQSYAADANNTTISNPPTTISKTVSLTGLNIAASGLYYLCWTFTGSGGSTNGQGIGIDNLSLTATLAAATYTCTYDGNGNTGGTVPTDTSSPYASGATVTVLANTGALVRTGYTFAGWNTATNGGGTDYAATGSATLTMPASNTVLYAKWTPTYTLTYNGNSNTGGTAPTDASSPYASGATVTVLANTGALVRTGYTFAGWNAAANGGGTDYAATGSATLTMPAANTILYAKWTANINTITFDKNAADATGTTASQNIATAATASLNSNGYNRIGYTFAGWATTAGGALAYTNTASYTMGTASVTLYAVWTALGNFTVTFNANGGTGTMSPQITNTATALTTNTFTRSGFIFAGWNTIAVGGGTAYPDGASYPFTADVTLYAQWTATYTLTYNGNSNTSGTAPTDSSSPYLVGATATVLANTGALVRTGYTFAGWNAAANGSGADYAATGSATLTIPAANTILYAKWTANNNTITFDKNAADATGTTASQTLASDATATLTSNGYSRTGYTFTGWATTAGGAVAYTNNASYTIGTASVTLYAVWTANNNTITFDKNAADATGTMANQTIATAATAALTTNGFTRTGYIFDGWATTSGGVVAFTNSANYTMGTANVILYAIWTATPNLVITEFAGAGYANSFNDEYIEISNFGNSTVSLAGWTLEYYNSTTLEATLNLTGSIAANAAYVIAARTSYTAALTPNFVPSSSFSMNSTGYAILKMGSTTIDQAATSAGKFSDSKNYELTNCSSDNSVVANWADLGTGNGTPGVVNCVVVCTNPSLAFATPSYSKNIGDANFTQTATTSSPATISYTSNNTVAATVNATTGEVTIGATPGTATITATQAANGSYCAATATYTVIVTALPAITLADNGTQIAAANVNQGATNQVLHQFSLTVTTANATLTGIQVTTAGTYATTDLTNLKVRYSTDATLDSGDATLSTYTTVPTAGTLTFPSFSSQVITSGNTGYIFITADIAGSAVVGNTISVNAVTTAQISFNTGTESGTTTAAGAQTIVAATPNIAIADNGTQVNAANVSQGKSNHILSSFQLTVTTTSTTLTQADIYFDGTYAAADIVTNGLKLWYSTTNNFATASALGSASSTAAASSGDSISFTSLSQGIAAGTTGYFWVTASLSATATATNTIRALGVVGTDLTFSAGNKSGSASIGGTQTIIIATPAITIADNGTQVTAASVLQGATNQVLHKFSLAVTTATATLTGIDVTTAGTYATSDLTNLKVRYSADATLDGADTTLSTYTTVPTAGTLTFPSFASQGITLGTTGYIFITADIAGSAVVGNTISVNAVTTAGISFSTGTKSGTTTAGGLQTVTALTPVIAIADNGTQVTAANVNQGTTNQVLHKFSLAVTSANATLTGIQVTTAGTYATTDLTNLKVRYSVDATLDVADATLSTYTTVPTAGTLTFPSFTSQGIASGTTGYIFITADIAASPVAGNTISVNAVTTAQISFSAGTESGTTTAGGVQTVVPALLQWNTFGNAGTETTEPSVFNDSNITATNLTQGNITAAGNTNRFGGSGWWSSTGYSASSTLSEAVTGNDYIQFIVTPNSGYTFTPTSFVFNWDRSTFGPSSVSLRSSVDSFANDLGTVTGLAASLTSGNTITISGLSNITTATTFRLYGYGASASTGTGGFDQAGTTPGVVNVQLNGTTAAAGPTITLASLTAGMAASPLMASNTNKAVFGFSATATAASTMTAFNLLTSSTSVNKFTNIKLYSSADTDYSTAGDNTLLTGFTFAQTATQLQFSGLTESLSTTAKNYFIVIDVDSSVLLTTPNVQVSLTNANLSLSTGTVTGGPITGTDYSFDIAGGTPKATLSGTLSETTLNTGTFTITLTNETFSNFVATPIDLTLSNFTLNSAPTGTTITKVTATSSTAATVTLAFDGTDFDTTSTPTLTIAQAELVRSAAPLISTTLTITPLNEAIAGATTTAAFTTTLGVASAAQTFTVSGNNTLRAPLVATAPTGFEVSSNGGSTYASTASFTAATANAGATLYIRIAASASIGTYNAQPIVLSSTSAASVNITTPASGNSVNPNNNSDVIFNNSSSTSTNTNLLYANYQGTTLTSTASSGANASVGVMGLYARDGGSTLSDTDLLDTELTAITFTVTNAANIRFARLFDGTTPLGTPVAVTGGNTLVFSGLSIIATDGAQKAFNLRITFNSTVTDNDKMVFTVTSVTANPVKSTFKLSNGGGASSDNTAGSDINRIEVIADRLAFSQQPTNNSVTTNLSPSPAVSAVDSLNNTDKDVTTGTITITSTGTLITPQSATPSLGVATFATMSFSDAGTWQLTATYTLGTGPLTAVNSATFTISTITYVHGDYRSTGSGTWLGTSTASWEKYSSVTQQWTAASEPASNYTTASIYIGNGTTVTTGSQFGGVDINVLSGGTFNCTFNSTAASLHIYDGGTASFSGSQLKISGDFEIDDNGTFIYNYKSNAGNSSSTRAGLWNGTEKFHPKSNFIIKDHEVGTGKYFLPVADTDISTQNYDGVAAYFGNLIIDLGSSVDNNTFRLTSSNTGTDNSNFNNKILTYGDLIFRTSNSSTNPNLFYGSTTLTINGNLKIEDTYTNTNISGTPTSSTITGVLNVKGNFINESAKSFVLNNSTAGTMTLNVDGNIQLNTTNANAGTFSLNSATGNVSTVNLKGDLTVGATGLLTTSLATTANNTFNFSGTGTGLSAATTQTIDVASTGLSTRNQYITFNVNSGAYVQLANRDFELGLNSTFTVKGSGSTGGTLDFGFSGTTPLNITSYSSGTRFTSEVAATLKISSTAGISATSGTSGNVQVTIAPTYNSTGTFHYLGKSNQTTGTGLPTANSAKIVIAELVDNTTTLSLSNSVSISSGTTLDALGGKLEIRKGTVIGSTSADFSGTGRLVMTDGVYKISTITAIPASNYLPQLSNYSNYSLTGGTINLNGTSATANQILSGTPTYYNLAFSGSNVYGTNYKGISSGTGVINSITISETAIVDVKTNSLGGTPNVPSFTMTDTSRYITDGGGAKPDAGGVYSLASGTTIEFANSSAEATVRLGTTPINYAKVIVSGTKVSNASVSTGIQFQSGGTFTVNNGAIFKLQNTAGFTGSTATAISNTNSPTVSLLTGSTIEYAKTTATNAADQSITAFTNTIVPAPTYSDSNRSYSKMIISGAAKKIISGSTEVLVGDELSISGGTLQIDSNKLLTVNNAIKNTSGNPILVKDSGNLVQITEVDNATTNANTGSITMTRTSRVMVENDYIYWGSPVKENVISQIPSSYDATYQWDLTGAIEGSWNALSTIVPGRGFITKVASGVTTAKDFDFTGTANNGTVNVTANAYDTNFDLDTTGNTILLANPYPSALDATKFYEANTSILDGTFYFWTSSTANSGSTYSINDYASWNKLGGTSAAPPSNPILSLKPTGKIAAGQGFFADIHADGIISFTNAMRERSPSNNSQFFKTTKANKTVAEKHRIWLNLTNKNNAFRQMLVGYITDATNGFDRAFDGEAFTDNEINIYSVLEDKTLVIQGRSLPFEDTDTVPLGIVITNAGEYTIAIDEVDGVFINGQDIYLEDKLLNVIANLRNPYTFNAASGTFNDRFVLRYTDKTLGTTDFEKLENQVLVSTKSKQIKVNSRVESIDKVIVYDLLGRQLFKKDKVNSAELIINSLVSNQQTLLVKVTLQNGQTVTRKIMF